MSDIKAMEHSTLKVPYEILNKKFRTTQKTMDREASQMQNISNEIDHCLSVEHSRGMIKSELKQFLQRLEVFKKKSDENIDEEIFTTRICKKKLHHIKEWLSKTTESNMDLYQASTDQWKKKRLDRMIVEHLLRSGHYNTATLLCQRTNIRQFTNLDIFQISKEVEEDLKTHKTIKCSLWCNDNKSKLRKINSTIEFHIKMQEFIELVRENKRKDAVKFARKYFSFFEKDHLKEICQVMAILAFQSNTKLEPYKSLFDPKRWENLVLSFRNENFRLYQLSNQSLLSVIIQTGLSSLKTPHCYSNNSRNLKCPVCQKDFNLLGVNLPYSHCAQSRLICRVSGLPLNEHNLPMMLPNGQIFGQKALAHLTKEDGVVVCPITKQVWCDPKIEKVFVM